MCCDQLLKGSFAFAYYYFGDDDDMRTRSYGRDLATQTRKLLFEQGQADLNARTETLSDVVARKRLRASRTIIGQATRIARLARLAFERILVTCTSEIDADVVHSRSGSRRIFTEASQQQPRRRVSRSARRSDPPPQQSRRRAQPSEEARAVADAAPPPPIGGAATSATASDFLDQQLRMILQSLDDLGGLAGSLCSIIFDRTSA